MRGALAFAAAAGVFVGTIFLGGRAIGAWDDLQSRPAAPSAEPNSSLRVPAGWIVHRVPREGFALALPLGWQTDDPGTLRERLVPIMRANPELAPFVEAGLSGRNPAVKLFAFDVRRTALAAARHQRFVTNASVIVAPGPPPWNVSTPSLRRSLAIPGPLVRRRLALPAGRALELRYNLRFRQPSGPPAAVVVTQYGFARGNKQYVVTFTTTPGQVELYSSLFRQSAETFRFLPRRQPKSRPDAEARWLRDLNALCRRARHEFEALRRPETPAEAEALLSKLVTLNKRYNDAFAALDPPAQFETEMRRLRRLFAKDERLLDSMLAAVGTGSPPAVLEVANRLATVGERERALLAEFGATDCDVDDLDGAL